MDEHEGQFYDVGLLVVALKEAGDKDWAFVLEQECFQQMQTVDDVTRYPFAVKQAQMYFMEVAYAQAGT